MFTWIKISRACQIDMLQYVGNKEGEGKQSRCYVQCCYWLSFNYSLERRRGAVVRALACGVEGPRI